MPAIEREGYNPRTCLLYGSRGQALSIFMEEPYFNSKPVGFIDDFSNEAVHQATGLPIRPYAAWKHDPAPILLSMGDPRAKRAVAEKVDRDGLPWARFLPPRMMMPVAAISCGDGTYVSHFANAGHNVTIGRHVSCMALVSLGHDVTIGDHVTICPGVTISGYVVIEDDCFIGAGAAITNGTPDRPIVIGEGSVIGTGAVVLKSVPRASRMIGNPAIPIREMARQRLAMSRA